MNFLDTSGHHNNEESQIYEEALETNNQEVEAAEHVLETVEYELARVRKLGVSKASIVAVESIRPGTFDPRIIKMASTNHSRTNYGSAIVALEDAKSKGSLILMLAIISGIIMILKWIMSGGATGKGPGSLDPEEGKKKLDEKVAAAGEIDELSEFGGLHKLFSAALGEVHKSISATGKFDSARMMNVINSIGALKNDPSIHKYIENIVERGAANPLSYILKAGYEDKNLLEEAVPKAFARLLKTVPFNVARSMADGPLKEDFESGRLRMWSDVDIRGASDTVSVIRQVFSTLKELVSFDKEKTSLLDKTLTGMMQIVDLDEPVTGLVVTMNGKRENVTELNTNLDTLSGKGVVNARAFHSLYVCVKDLQLKDQVSVIGTLTRLQGSKAIAIEYKELNSGLASLIKSVEDQHAATVKASKDEQKYRELQEPIEGRPNVTGLSYLIDTLNFLKGTLLALGGVKTAMDGHNVANGYKTNKK